MNHQQNNENLGGEILKTVGLWFWLIAVGAWYLSMLLTKALLLFVINPLLDGALDKDNGDLWVMGISTTLWEMVALALFGGLIVPDLHGASPDAFRQALAVMAGAGLLWGISIGFWIVVSWWSSEEMQEPIYEPERQLGAGVKIVSGADGGQLPGLPSKEELAQELAEISSGADARPLAAA